MLKVFRFIRTEGIWGTLYLIFDNVLKAVGLRPSKTYIYRLGIDQLEARKYEKDDFEPIVIHGFSEIEDFRIAGRLDKGYFKNKLERGSICAVNFDVDKVVAYSWVHFSEHRWGGDLKLVFDENSAWLGPIFTHRAYRGKNLSTRQLCWLADYLRAKGFRYLIASTNTVNYPMMKIFLRSGFRIVGLVIIRKLFGLKLNVKKYDFHRDKLLDRHLEIV